MSRPKLLDLFCGTGGAAVGYYRAGFDVVGVDVRPQPHYPFEFHQEDALDVLTPGSAWWPIDHFDAIHASPPCQAFSNAQRIRGNKHPDLLTPVRELLCKTFLPYVIENVVGAPMRDPVILCGAMFPPLKVYRHRLFETNWDLPQPDHPEHVVPLTKMGRRPVPGTFMHVVGKFSGADYAREAMGMPWATVHGLREAIPPAYTEYVGMHLFKHLCIVET